MNDDDERFKFLDRLSRSNCALTVSEAEFVDRLQDEPEFQTDQERAWCDRMRKRFEPELKGR